MAYMVSIVISMHGPAQSLFVHESLTDTSKERQGIQKIQFRPRWVARNGFLGESGESLPNGILELRIGSKPFRTSFLKTRNRDYPGFARFASPSVSSVFIFLPSAGARARAGPRTPPGGAGEAASRGRVAREVLPAARVRELLPGGRAGPEILVAQGNTKN